MTDCGHGPRTTDHGRTNLHANVFAYKSKGVMLLGPSGAGKSDLTLRMVMQKGAKLVADDRVEVEMEKGNLYASPPRRLRGLLEIRGIGIKRFPYARRHKIHLVVELAGGPLERLPQKEFYELEGVRLPKIRLDPFEISAAEKIIAAL